ncbi:MAG TPA: FtsX-like permease family protein [Thermoanaerobaculia bacterium]|jgi:lipoprotein-releasing system permease protein
MIEGRIARRYLWAARKQRHTAFLSVISMLGLAIGVAALLISIALLTGLQEQIKSRLIASSPTILIEPAGKNAIDDAPAIIDAAKRMGMRDIEPVVSGIAWGANEGEKRGRPMRIRSIATRHGPLAEDTILTTRMFAASIGVDTGDVVTVVAPRTRLTPFGPVPVWKKFRIARLVIEASDERAADAYLEMNEAEGLFATNGKPTSIEMYGNTDREEEVQSQLARTFPAVQVKTWKEINRPLFLALRLEKIVMFATISLIIFVAALNLISSLAMLIMEKRPQVGVLRTLGATEKNILRVFLQVGLLIGLTGTILGNAFGLGLAWAANRYHLIPLPRDIYFISYLPFRLDVADVVSVNLIAVFLSVVATWYPARIASRLDPITAIREE